MKAKDNIYRISLLSLGVAVALAVGFWFISAAHAQEHGAGHGAGPAADSAASAAAQPPMQMNHVKTQAEAEALKPGDAMSMTCAKCKVVTVQKVTADKAHVKMMTVGEKLTCPACEGSVEVVATGKGEGKDAEVKHVCSKCGDDAMFCAATKPGSGAMQDMDKDKMKDMGKDKMPHAGGDKMKGMEKMKQ